MPSAQPQRRNNDKSLDGDPSYLVALMEAHLKSKHFICWPGRVSLNQGLIDIQAQVLPFTLKGLVQDTAGKFPDIKDADKLQSILRPSIAQMQSGKKDAVVYVLPRSPENHNQAFNLAYALWIEIAVAVKSTSFDPTTLQRFKKAYRRGLQKQFQEGICPNSSIDFSGQSSGVFGTALSPLFPKGHGRWAPAFSIAVVTHRALAQMSKHEQTSKSIKQDAYKRAGNAYNLKALYPIPDNLVFLSGEQRYAIQQYENILGDSRLEMIFNRDKFIKVVVDWLVENAGERMGDNARKIDTAKLCKYLLEINAVRKREIKKPASPGCPFAHLHVPKLT